jgi:hypothetical protein
MTTMRRPAAPTGERRGNAVILVLLLTFALAALAGSAIMLSQGAKNVATYHNREADLKLAADAGLQLGISNLSNNPFRLPTTGKVQLASNAQLMAADSTAVHGITYSTWAGITGSASRQLGRFVTVVTQVNDTAHKRSFVRRAELVEETFAKFAYYSETENGICFGSGDRLTGPIFSNTAISSCAGQKASFMDSVETAQTFTNGNPSQDTLYKPPAREHMTPIQLPSTSKLASLFTVAAFGNTEFDVGNTQNTNTDSVSKVKQRIEFVAYRMHPTDPDSTVEGSGFVRYLAVPKANPWWTTGTAGYTTAQKDSAQSNYLRAGLLHHANPLNCGDWHWVRNDAGAFEWEFFPAYAHGLSGFTSILLSGDAESLLAFPSSPSTWSNATGISKFKAILTRGTLTSNNNIPTQIGTNPWPTAGSQPGPTCFPAGDPHLVYVERMGATQAGLTGYTALRPTAAATGGKMWQKGGTDTTFTISGTLSTWATNSIAVTWPGTFASTHPDALQQMLFPIDTVYNHNFQGVIAVHGTVAISGNVNGHITVYTDGSASMIDNLRLTTSTGDTACLHGVGIVAGQYILPADNGINVPQHVASNIYASLRQNRGGPISNDLYIQSTVMALQSWGAEQLTPDSTFDQVGGQHVGFGGGSSNGPELCNGTYFIRGCVWVWGSIIQNGRVTINGCGATNPNLPSSGYDTNWGCGYSKQYQYDECAVINPLPDFPTTGRYSLNKYYEIDPNKFNVDSLFRVLAPPP